MDQVTASTLLTWLTVLLGPTGLTVGLLIVVWMFYTERWVPGARAKRAEDLADRALAIAHEANETAKATLDAVRKRNEVEAKLLARRKQEPGP